MTAASRLRVPEGPLSNAEWRAFYRVVESATQKGHFQTALRILRGLERAGNKAVAVRQGYYCLALVHSVRATVLDRAGDRRSAAREFLAAARLAFLESAAGVDMLTNSLWAAVERMPSFASRAELVATVRRFNYRGARYHKEVGDWMNDLLIAAGMEPVIFGGKYPAAVGDPTVQLREQRKRARRKK